jgi:CxxC motif-containing protein (DUF1111 family)
MLTASASPSVPISRVPDMSALVLGRKCVVAAALACVGGWGAARAAEEPGVAPAVKLGECIFHHNFGLPATWKEPMALGAGGDGLGPQFNDASCVACHKQGGAGGGGPNEKNALILSFNPVKGLQRTALERIVHEANQRHPELSATQTSAPLHRFGLPGDKDRQPYEDYLAKVFTEVQMAADNPQPARAIGKESAWEVCQRNTTALWGIGLIEEFRSKEGDAVRKRLMEEQNQKYPWLSGRVPRDAQQRESWFGWRGQLATLHDFNLGACATEVGLSVPGVPQHLSPVAPGEFAEGLDLTDAQCRSLTAFVASLPAPVQVLPTDPSAAARVAMGEQVFNNCRCNACHVRDLAWLRGVYSDLVLHDMGPELCDCSAAICELMPGEVVPTGFKPTNGQYYGPPGNVFVPPKVKPSNCGCEWRTPPLWGCADSAPYLHDGRAPNLDAAIRAHGGEGETSRQAYGQLSDADRSLLLEFLETLRAPQNARANASGTLVLNETEPAPRPVRIPAQPAESADEAAAPAAASEAAVDADAPAVAAPAVVEVAAKDYEALVEILERLKPTTSNVQRARGLSAQLKTGLPEAGAADFALALFQKQALQTSAMLETLSSIARQPGPYAARARQALIREDFRRREVAVALTAMEQHAAAVSGDPTLSLRDVAEQAEWLGVVCGWLCGPSGLNNDRVDVTAGRERVRGALTPELQSRFDAGETRVESRQGAYVAERTALVTEAGENQQTNRADLAGKQAELTVKQAELAKSREELEAAAKKQLDQIDVQLAELEKQYVERDQTDRRLVQTLGPLQSRAQTLLTLQSFATLSSSGTTQARMRFGAAEQKELQGLADQINLLNSRRTENTSQARILAMKAEGLVQNRQALVNQYQHQSGQASQQLASLSKWQSRLTKQSQNVEGTSAEDAKTVQRLERKVRELATYDRFDAREEARLMLARYRPRE